MVLQRPEDRLNSAIQARQEPAAGPSSDFQPQLIDVLMQEGRPAYRLGSRVLFDKPALTAALEPLNKSTGLFIRVGDQVSAGFAIAAFQAGHDAGFTQVTYVLPD
jgi:hypothetical protein